MDTVSSFCEGQAATQPPYVAAEAGGAAAAWVEVLNAAAAATRESGHEERDRSASKRRAESGDQSEKRKGKQRKSKRNAEEGDDWDNYPTAEQLGQAMQDLESLKLKTEVLQRRADHTDQRVLRAEVGLVAGQIVVRVDRDITDRKQKKDKVDYFLTGNNLMDMVAEVRPIGGKGPVIIKAKTMDQSYTLIAAFGKIKPPGLKARMDQGETANMIETALNKASWRMGQMTATRCYIRSFPRQSPPTWAVGWKAGAAVAVQVLEQLKSTFNILYECGELRETMSKLVEEELNDLESEDRLEWAAVRRPATGSLRVAPAVAGTMARVAS